MAPRSSRDWSDGATTAARTELNVTQNLILEAHFEVNTYTLAYAAGSFGTISGVSPQTVQYGCDGTEVVAIPVTGYHFIGWSDGVTTAARTDLAVTQDMAVDVEFAIDNYTLVYTAGAGGMVSGTSPQVRSYGDDGALVTAIPDDGYSFVQWSDGVPTAERTDTAVAGNIDVQATFVAAGAPAGETVGRLGGSTRYAVAVASAEEAYPAWTGVRDVVIASGENRAQSDSLTAAGLAGALDAPLLLVRYAPLDSLVRSAIAAMPAGVKVHIVGGPASVSNGTQRQLVAVDGVASVDRVSGADRYSAAAAVARRMKVELVAQGKALPSAALIVNGNNPNTFYDALAASAVSAGNSFPVLLVQNGSVPGPTGAALRDLDLSHRYIVGNKLSVSESVRTSLGVAVGDRISGADRYAIAAALAVRARSEGWLSNTFVGFAANIPDAATGGALMGKRGGALLYVSSSAIPAATSGYLLGTAGEITGATVFGGTSSVSEGVRVRLETLIQ